MKLKFVKKTGLVPVRMLVTELPYSAGDIRGLTPGRAVKAIFAKPPTAELVDIPQGIETGEIAVEAPSPAKEPASPDSAAEIEIPADWETLHHLKRFKLASLIKGDKVKTADEANAIIAAELARRAGKTQEDV